MRSGAVKWFDPIKGYGFIQPDDGSRSVYVHKLAVERAEMAPLESGQKINFELEWRKLGKVPVINLRVAWLVPQAVVPH